MFAQDSRLRPIQRRLLPLGQQVPRGPLSVRSPWPSGSVLSSHLWSLIIIRSVLPPQRCISQYVFRFFLPRFFVWFGFGTFLWRLPYFQKQTSSRLSFLDSPNTCLSRPCWSAGPQRVPLALACVRPLRCACELPEGRPVPPLPMEPTPDLLPLQLPECQLNEMQPGGWRHPSSTCASSNVPPGGSLSRCRSRSLFYPRAGEGLGGRGLASCGSKICNITGPLGGTPPRILQNLLSQVIGSEDSTDQEMGDAGGEMKARGQGGPGQADLRWGHIGPPTGTWTRLLTPARLCLENPLGGLSLSPTSAPQGAHGN